MLCDKDKKKLQQKLEDLHCNQCDIILCGGCCCDCGFDSCCDVATSKCDCCVDQIVSIEDSIINIQNTSFISICNISRVRWRDIGTINQINLLLPVCTCEECDCCERPLRENLNKFINANVSLQFKGQQDLNAFQSLTIRKVGLGIVVGQNTVDGAPDAYSICKITRFNAI